MENLVWWLRNSVNAIWLWDLEPFQIRKMVCSRCIFWICLWLNIIGLCYHNSASFQFCTSSNKHLKLTFYLPPTFDGYKWNYHNVWLRTNLEGCRPSKPLLCYVTPQLHVLNARLLDEEESWEEKSLQWMNQLFPIFVKFIILKHYKRENMLQKS